MKSTTTDRLWRIGVFLAWLPIATAPWAAEGPRPDSATMPAAADASRVEIVGDALVIEGTPGDDRIVIRATRHPDTVRVVLNGVRLGRFGPVAEIVVHAGDGDDTVLVSGAVELPARLNGGPGHDRLRGGGGPDLVFGEDGDDVLVATFGRDGLDGGQGSNRLVVRRPMGEIRVGSSAAGDALRILSKAYDLPPLDADRDGADLSATETGPIVVGPAELLDDAIVDLLSRSYQAGHTIALAGAEATDAELLRRLLGHTSGASWDAGIPQADLIAYRRAIRPDGQLHESTSILVPRQAVEGLSRAEARRGRREADMLAVEALSGVFSGTPVLTDSDGVCMNVSPEQCLQTLASSYESKTLASNTAGMQVQLVNSVWGARSFQNQEDLFYVLQEIDYHVGFEDLWLTREADAVQDPFGPPNLISLLQPSPPTTMETTEVTSGVSLSLGGSIGYNQADGVNATGSVGLSIENSTTKIVPAVIVTNESVFVGAEAIWKKEFKLGGSSTVTFLNQWIWEIAFGAYPPEQQLLYYGSAATLTGGASFEKLTADLEFITVPIPFGVTFVLGKPMVTSVEPTSVAVGDEFTIAGTGLYPSLVTGVLIGGQALAQANFSTVSDTEITVVAPDRPGSSLPVVVQTTEGVSNATVTIDITGSLASPAGSTAPGVARTRSAAADMDP